LAWPSDYKIDPSWLNPWPIKYLMPSIKWFPLYWPNMEWEVVSMPPAFDENGNRVKPQPPDGAMGPWWKMLPKEQWPLEAPWAEKWFGAWNGNQVTIAEDLKPSIWPGPYTTPPFGFIKVKMPGTPEVSGYQGPKGFQIPFNHMRMQMRPEIGPIHRLKVMTRNTPMGQKFYMIDEDWEQHEYDYKQYRKALKARKEERFMNMLAEEIARTGGIPKPSKDLFT
jgi:hypothetical protein